MAVRAAEQLAAGFAGVKISVVITRRNVAQLDEFATLAKRYGRRCGLTRSVGRGTTYGPTCTARASRCGLRLAGFQRRAGAHRHSFFHLAPLGQSGLLAGLNMCGAGRVVYNRPVGDVYACPFMFMTTS